MMMRVLLSMSFLVLLASKFHVVYELLSHDNNNPIVKSSIIILFLGILYDTLVRKLARRRRKRRREVYLVDFACYKPEESRLFSNKTLIERAEGVGHLSEDTIKFVRKMMDRSGLGPNAYIPEGLGRDPPDTCFKEALEETQTIMFGAIDEVLKKTGIDGKEIGIVVVNCSVYSPVPSLCDMIVNRYNLRDNVVTYNLSGMGCSAGMVGIDLAKRLLQVIYFNFIINIYI